jgi:hypothetical protein
VRRGGKKGNEIEIGEEKGEMEITITVSSSFLFTMRASVSFIEMKRVKIRKVKAKKLKRKKFL